jgi:small conductance mechanosensitive channel
MTARNQAMNRWQRAAVIALGSATPAALAAEPPAAPEAPAPVTASDPAVPVSELELRLLPLTKAELDVEAGAWMQLLANKVRQIADAEIDVSRQNAAIAAAPDAEQAAPAERAKAELLERLVALRADRTALIDRVEVVLDALVQKGGDAAAQRRYVNAVSGVHINVADTSAAWATLTGWLRSPDGGIRWGINALKFLGCLVAAWIVALLVGKAVDRALRLDRRLSKLMRQFISRSVRRVVLAVGAIVALSALEINVGPVLAAIGAAGLVIGLALQGTLGNFASGILILFYRPFDVGDVIEVAGVSGIVDSLSLVSTTIKTADNKVQILPNNSVWGSVITNVTGTKQRRVDMVFGVAYDADLARAQAILERIVTSHPLVLEEPAPVVKVNELGDSAVKFVCRPWVKTTDYGTVYWDVTRSVKEELDHAGIAIPFPQHDVHVYHQTPEQPQRAAPGEPPVAETLRHGRERSVHGS